MIDATAGLSRKTHPEERSDGAPAAQENEQLYNSLSITVLPPETVEKILFNLDLVDISACRLVCRSWRELIDNRHLQARAFYSICHSPEYLPGSHTDERYLSSIRDWLSGFGSEGEKAVVQLDKLESQPHFS